MTLEASISARRRLLLEALSAGASHLPPASFRSVWVATPAGSVRVGRISPDALHALEKEPGIECDGGNVLLRPDWGEPLEALLERLGREARAKGLAPRWRGERLDLFPLPPNCRQAPLARMERALFRTFGCRTRVVRLLAARKQEGRPAAWLLGRRSAHKSIGPGLWDNLAAGMVAAGETRLAGLAVVGGGTAGEAAPCGICRQFLLEFAPELTIPVYLSGADGAVSETTLGDLCPLPFQSFRADGE